MKPVTHRNGRFLPFENLLEDFFGPELSLNLKDQGMTSNPRTNIIENNNEFFLELLVPGFDKNDIKVNIDKNTLTISAEVENTLDESKGNVKRKEFSFKSFKRSFTLPDTVQEEAITAQYSNGVLNLTLPKKEEAKPLPARSISVN